MGAEVSSGGVQGKDQLEVGKSWKSSIAMSAVKAKVITTLLHLI